MSSITFPERPLLNADPVVFARDFDKKCFTFTHRLSDNPLFGTDRLLALARQRGRDPRDVYYDAGEIRVDQRWDQTPPCDLPVDELLRHIETAGAWILLRRVQEDPKYARLLDACMDEIVALSGRELSQVMKLRDSIIFINSPHRITTYHIDRECSWLYQIRGRKTISIFEPTDRDVLPEWEIERFWAVDNNAATYRPQYQSRATVIELLPGQGVHIPVGAPHWVRNGPEVSVSLNINFHYLDAITANVYRANYWLRRLGLNPTPPRVSAFKDAIKRSVYGTVNRTVLQPARAARGAIRAMKHPARKI
ncbi:MAG TPA: cupin-like domain-containing protein [Methylocella sp.]